MIHVKRMVALRTTQDFSMQHITSRGCRLDPLELSRLPAASSCAQEGRILQTTSPSPSLHSWPLPALQWRWVQTLGGQPLLDVSKDPSHPSGPSQVHAAVFPPFVAPQIQLSVPSDPRHPLHNINMQLLVFVYFIFFKCTLAALLPLTPHPFAPPSIFSFFSSVAAKHKARIRLCTGW